MLREVYVIARREMLERVRSKWYIAMTLLGPILMIAIILVPSLFASNGEGAKVEIVDRSGVLGQPVSEALHALSWRPAIVSPDTADQREMDRIRDKQINGFITIPADALTGGKILYRGDNGASLGVQQRLGVIFLQLVPRIRGEHAGVPRDKLDIVMAPVQFEAQQTDGKARGSSGAGSFWLGYAVAYVLMLVILIYGVAVMRSVVQEKTSRVMELMVATVKPRSLMTGKIAGVGVAGLIQTAVWMVMGALTLRYRNELLGLFGKPPSEAPLPALAGGEVAMALAFFVLGYFFYAALYAAVGAMLSSEQDAQQMQTPVMALLLLGFGFFSVVGGDPRGTAAMVLTQLPFWSPLLMPLRYLLGGASAGEVVLSLGILTVSSVLIARAAAKIYRVGVLMYGKRPGLGELLRWLRY